MKWTDLPVHVIDFEGSVRTGVVEFGVVTLEDGEIRAVDTRLCKPLADISPVETRVHGIDGREVDGAEPFAAEWHRFAGLRETGVLAAHFSATENALLRAAWSVPRLSPDFLSPGRSLAEWGPWIDTGRLSVEAMPVGAGAGLEDVIRFFQLEAALAAAAERWCPQSRRHFHGAAFDALASALVLRALARDASGEPWTLSRVLAASTADERHRAERQQPRWF